MPPRRIPTKQQARSQVSPVLALQFGRMCELGSIYLACIRGSTCHAPTPNEHCAECSEHFNLHHSLVRHFKLPAVLFDLYEQSPDTMSESEKVEWWTDALEKALETAREEDLLKARRRR